MARSSGGAPAAPAAPAQPQGMAGQIAQRVVGQAQAQPQGVAGQVAQRVAGPAMQQRQTGIAPPQAIPRMADGGQVTKQRAKLDVDAHYENKSFERKPNGKPC